MDIHAPKKYSDAMLTVVETPLFQRQWPLYLTEEERGAFAAYIAERPTAGEVVPESGGIRVGSLGSRRFRQVWRRTYHLFHARRPRRTGLAHAVCEGKD